MTPDGRRDAATAANTHRGTAVMLALAAALAIVAQDHTPLRPPRSRVRPS